MTPRQLTHVGLTILGLYFLIRGIEQFPRTLQFFSFGNILDISSFSIPWIQLIPPLTSLIAACILIGYGGKIALKLFNTEDESVYSQEVPPQEFYVIAFSISGILLLTWNIFPLLNLPIQILFPLNPEKTKEAFGANFWAQQVFNFGAALLEAGIGVYLIIRARQLAGLILRLQNRRSASGEANVP